jgi:hypothetical protein
MATEDLAMRKQRIAGKRKHTNLTIYQKLGIIRLETGER